MSWLSNMLSSFVHPERGYDAAAAKQREYWDQAKGYQTPYMNAGTDQIGKLNDAQGKLLNPSDLLNDWMSKYKTSAFAQKSMDNAKEAGMSGASSMGLLGSSAALNNVQQSSSDIMNADRQQYLSDMMQKYMAGIGIGQNMFGVGANTAGNLGRESLEVGNDQGAAAYGSKNAPGNLLKDLLAMAANTYGQYSTGGKSNNAPVYEGQPSWSNA